MNKTSKNRLFIIIGLVVVALALFLIFQLNKDANNDKGSESETMLNDGETIVYLGDDNATNEILFAFDYSCPWCTVWVEEILPDLKEYIESGDTKLRTQSLGLLNPISLKLSQVDQNLKVHYANDYYDVFQEVIKDSSDIEITDAYLEELATKYDLDSDVLLGSTDLNMTNITNEYLEDYNIESVPAVIINGEKVEDPFDLEEIEAMLVREE